ncbi:MAG: hypothetical protein DMD50_06710 [Gemmatimonadetes bacterium]|nr:MAG: hypothetical protein DMD50_06710 [Gemmatimonadota bacterium]
MPHINNTTLPIPVSISADFSAYDCSNNPGPQITFSGGSYLGGYGVEMTFTNNMIGTHSYTDGHTVDLSVMPANDQIVIPKQPVLGGAGGNPFIWVQFVGANGAALSGEIFVGRCVQGAGWHVTQSAATTASAYATFTVESCANSPGPYISFTSGVTMAGMSARIIFRNNDNPVGGPHQADVTRNVTVIPAGLNLTFPKQPVLGGVGGNPWIFAGFTDADGTPKGEATLLGRCEQLSKALS